MLQLGIRQRMSLARAGAREINPDAAPDQALKVLTIGALIESAGLVEGCHRHAEYGGLLCHAARLHPALRKSRQAAASRAGLLAVSHDPGMCVFECLVIVLALSVPFLEPPL